MGTIKAWMFNDFILARRASSFQSDVEGVVEIASSVPVVVLVDVIERDVGEGM